MISWLCVDAETINALMWSSRLDDVFSDNLKRDPTIYQYFASREGLLRYFPAHKYHLFEGEMTMNPIHLSRDIPIQVEDACEST